MFDEIIFNLSFISDTICINYLPIALPSATPISGLYSGAGISGSTFDPALSGVGNFWILYTYSDINSCTASDSTHITVNGCASIDDEENQNWFIFCFNKKGYNRQ